MQSKELFLADTIQGEINRMCVTNDINELYNMAMYARKNINKLCSMRNDDLKIVQDEQPKKGKWVKISPANIYECSECGQNVMTNDIGAYKFCHGCGAEMRG